VKEWKWTTFGSIRLFSINKTTGFLHKFLYSRTTFSDDEGTVMTEEGNEKCESHRLGVRVNVVLEEIGEDIQANCILTIEPDFQINFVPECSVV
jgi:hypothetical protein